MLRSRRPRPPRFHTSPTNVVRVYFSSAGATIRTLSRSFAGSACAAAGANRGNAAMVAVNEASRRDFIVVSPSVSFCQLVFANDPRGGRGRAEHDDGADQQH